DSVLATGVVLRETEEAGVPTHPGCGRAELLPHAVGQAVDSRDVLELHPGGCLIHLRQPDVHHRGLTLAHAPGNRILRGATTRRNALADLAARVPLQLVRAAQPQ